MKSFDLFSFLNRGSKMGNRGYIFVSSCSLSFNFRIRCSPLLVLVLFLRSLHLFPFLVPCLGFLSWLHLLVPFLRCLSWLLVFVPSNYCKPALIEVKARIHTPKWLAREIHAEHLLSRNIHNITHFLHSLSSFPVFVPYLR